MVCVMKIIVAKDHQYRRTNIRAMKGKVVARSLHKAGRPKAFVHPIYYFVVQKLICDQH